MATRSELYMQKYDELKKQRDSLTVETHALIVDKNLLAMKHNELKDKMGLNTPYHQISKESKKGG